MLEFSFRGSPPRERWRGGAQSGKALHARRAAPRVALAFQLPKKPRLRSFPLIQGGTLFHRRSEV